MPCDEEEAGGEACTARTVIHAERPSSWEGGGVTVTQFLQIVLSGLTIGCIYALATAGLNLVFGVFDVLNAAHGEFLMLGGIFSFYLWGWGIQPLLTIPISAVVMFAVGALTQLSLVEWVVKTNTVISLILLFGLGAVIRSVALSAFGPNEKTIRYYQGSYDIFGIFLSQARVVVMLVALPMLVLAHLYLRYTRLGVATRATAESADVAEACGINVKLVRIVTMGVSAAMAGIAGSLLILLFGMNPQSGFTFVIIAFACAVLGGLGNFYGSIVAGLILGVVEGLVSLYINPELAAGTAFFVMVVVLLAKPTGIAGARAAA